MPHKLAAIEKQIKVIKQKLQAIEAMRPGSLTLQYHFPQEKKGAFYQLSYTQNMQSRTDYVRREFVNDLKQQINNYRQFRKLIKRWVDLAIRYSKLQIDFAVKKK